LAREEALSKEDQYLLEINVRDISIGSGEAQEYWMLAIQAACHAKLLRDQIMEGIR
jgi:hypothetical protein